MSLKFSHEESFDLSEDRVLTLKLCQSGEAIYGYLSNKREFSSKQKSILTPLFRASSKELVTWPLNVREERDGCFVPKYESIHTIIIQSKAFQESSLDLPQTDEHLLDMMSQLPRAFSKECCWGFGLKKEYRFIIEQLETIEGITSLVITGGNCLKVDTPNFFLGIDNVIKIQRRLDSITRHYQSLGRVEKSHYAYVSILHGLDPIRYPDIGYDAPYGYYAKQDTANVKNLSLSFSHKKALIENLDSNIDSSVGNLTIPLLKLKTKIEKVSLDELIQKFRDMLKKNHDEKVWQKFFSNNPYILSLAFSIPAVKIRDQAFLGGITMKGTRAVIADFLFKSAATNNLAIIEIKKPTTRLLNLSPYRNSVFSFSKDLTGSISQVLSQRYTLQMEIPSFKFRDELYAECESYTIKCILIAGKLPEDKNQQKSFELMRNALSGVDVVTFDELLLKLEALKDVLSKSE